MISYNELKKGVKIILDNQPYEIIESSFLFKGRGGSVLRAKIKNLINRNLISKTFHPSDIFKGAELLNIEAKFLYSRPIKEKSSNRASQDHYFFCEKDNPSKRFNLPKEQIGLTSNFLKPNQIVKAIIWQEKIINISLPIKIELKVIEAPPGIKGNRVESGTKTITLETGAKINAPLFVKEGDIIEINTETSKYVKRVGQPC